MPPFGLLQGLKRSCEPHRKNEVARLNEARRKLTASDSDALREIGSASVGGALRELAWGATPRAGFVLLAWEIACMTIKHHALSRLNRPVTPHRTQRWLSLHPTNELPMLQVFLASAVSCCGYSGTSSYEHGETSHGLLQAWGISSPSLGIAGAKLELGLCLNPSSHHSIPFFFCIFIPGLPA